MTQKQTWRSLTQKILSNPEISAEDLPILTKMLIAIESVSRINYPVTSCGTFRNLQNSKQLTQDNHERLMQYLVNTGIVSKEPVLVGDDEVYPLDEDYYAEYKETGELYHPETGERVVGDELIFSWDYYMLIDPEEYKITPTEIMTWYDLPVGTTPEIGDRVLNKSVPKWLFVAEDNLSIVNESFSLGSVIAHMRPKGTYPIQNMSGYNLEHETHIPEGVEV